VSLTASLDEGMNFTQLIPAEVYCNFVSTGRPTELLVAYQARCQRCVQTDSNIWLFCAKFLHSSAVPRSSKVRSNVSRKWWIFI